MGFLEVIEVANKIGAVFFFSIGVISGVKEEYSKGAYFLAFAIYLSV